MGPSIWQLELCALLATYLLHSSLLLGGTWLVLRAIPRIPDPWQEALWRLALFGGLATSLLAAGLGTSPLAGAFDLALPAAAHPLVASPPSVLPPPTIAPSNAAAPTPDWISILLAGLAGGSLVFLLRELGLRLRLRALLAGRVELREGPLVRMLADEAGRVGHRRRVRLSVSPRVASPMAFGVLRPEICLPRRLLTEMHVARQRCVLAHELAHIRARDPLWLALARALNLLAFFQPLNRLASHRLLLLAELRCDRQACEVEGRGLALARSLLQVAEWLEPKAALPAGSVGMVHARSPLGLRVERALGSAETRSVPRWKLLPVLVLALGSFAATVPGLELREPKPERGTSPLAASVTELGARVTELDRYLAGLRAKARDRELSAATAELLAEASRRLEHLRAMHAGLAERVRPTDEGPDDSIPTFRDQ